MEFIHSEVISSLDYDTHGISSGVPLRRHRDTLGETLGAIRAQRDWSRAVAPIKNYKGGLGPEYNFIQVTVPECLPERLEILAYANEFAFLFDDAIELTEHNFTKDDNSKLLDVFRKDLFGNTGKVRERGEKQIQAKIFAEMMAIDQPRAMTTMKAWARFVQDSAARSRTKPFEGLADYLPYRIIDAGELIWFGTVTFGMALTIPDEELELCSQLVRPGFTALSLVNDLFSWEKEREAAKRSGTEHVVNAIHVIMQERSVDEETAKEICRTEIQAAVTEMIQVTQETKENPELSQDLKKYVEAIQYSHSGNLVWSLYCPRYHQDAGYNSLQSSLMQKIR